MADIDSPEVAALIDMIKDTLGGMAREILEAQESSGIQWDEWTSIITRAAGSAGPMVRAISRLNSASLRKFIDVMENSDIVMREKPPL